MEDREDTQARAPSTRRWRIAGRANLWIASLLLCAIILMVNYLAFRHFERWDWTSRNLFTLSERTEKVLSGLSQPVKLYLFMSRADPTYTEVKELVDNYRAETPQLSVRHVDPDRRPSEYRTLLQRFGLDEAVLKSGGASSVAAVLKSGDRTWHVMGNDLLDMDYESMGKKSQPKVDVQTERALTGGILEVTQGEKTRVCATTGHGEWSLEGGGQRSLSALDTELHKDNVELTTIETLGASSVPDECDAVFVIGPVNAFTAEEADLLGSYVKGGGRLLLALDPVFERDRIQSTGLEELCRRQLGVRIERAVVLERDSTKLLGPTPIEPFLITSYGQHETTESLRAMGDRTVVHLVRAITPLSGRATSLLETSDQGFGETNVAEVEPSESLAPDEEDMNGPVTVAAAVDGIGMDRGDAQKGETSSAGGGDDGGRAVVIGDSDWLRASFLQAPQFANYSLVSGWTGWLTEREALISIPPRKQDVMSVTMTEGDIGGVLFRVLVLMPAAVLLLGFAAWWSRRS